MFNTTNYYSQSMGLPSKNDYQRMLLQLADASTFSREISKIGTIVGFISSVSIVVFKFDPTIALTCTAACGVTWLVFSTCAKKLEPQAQNMLKYFKDLKDGTTW